MAELKAQMRDAGLEVNGGTHLRCRERLGGLLRYYHRAAWARRRSFRTLRPSPRVFFIRDVEKPVRAPTYR
jgi:hypothetical protein